MNWIEFANSIPIFLSYVAYGFLCLWAYKWIRNEDGEITKYFIIVSIILSYLLTTLYDILFLFIKNIGMTITNHIFQVGTMAILSLLIGFICGKISRSKVFSDVLVNIGVGRTANKFVWEDLLIDYSWVRVYMPNGKSYLGLYRYSEPNKSEPVIALGRYQVLDVDGKVIDDLSKDSNEYVVLNTKNFVAVEITHPIKK